MALTKVPNELSSTPSIVDGGNATAITIDSSQNVLAGKTALGVGNYGFAARADTGGSVEMARDGGTVLYVNRGTSDGQLLSLRKDNTEFGNIGVSGGNNLYISGEAANHAGLTFATQSVLPTTQGVINNNTVDLGQSGNGFKDIYLSGGAYLGGTAAANKLDLYETGTFTPVLKGSTATGSFTAGSGTTAKYVAIGDTVTISIALRNCTLSGASGDIYIDGCPFTLSTGVNYPIGGFMSHNLSFDTAHHQSFYGQSDNIFGMQSRTGTSWIGWPVTNSSGIYLHITMVCTKV